MLLIASETSDAIGSVTEISDKKFRLAVWIFDIVMIILMISFLYLYR